MGCKTNIYESEAMACLFKDAGYTVVQKGPADVLVINTCTVTSTGAAKSIKQIHRARRENPNAIIAVTGCLAQTEADRLKNTNDIDVLIGNRGKADIVKLCTDAINGKKTYNVSDILHCNEYEELGIVKGQNRTRAEIKIEDGCNNFCSYCKIPYARGPVRSRDMKNIIREAEAIANGGYKEIVLTGIHIGSYGKDLNNGLSLIDVMEAVASSAPDLRLRLGSIEPVMITEDFVSRSTKLKNLCPQFHLSLQSGCDKTLQAMRRRYTTDDFKKGVANLRNGFKDAAVTTDLIVGFPGETEDDFNASRDFCEEIGFSQMHIFPYSIREGTLAARLPHHVSDEEKTRRAHIMLSLAADMKSRFSAGFIGKTEDVLFEQSRGNIQIGHTKNYMEVKVPYDRPLADTVLPVLLTDYLKDGEYLTGKLI